MILRALLVLAGLYLAYGAFMTWAHRGFIYPFSPERFDRAGYDQVMVEVAGADPVTVYVSEAAPGRPVVIYFMGNAGSVELFVSMLEHHRTQGRQIVAMAYRGGGSVPGVSTEAVLKRDALALFDALQTLGATGPVVLQGYSLGTGVALHVAANRQVDGVILSAPYSQMCRLMAKAAKLPACLLPIDRWNSIKYASRVGAPVLHLHGTADTLIPVQQSSDLVAALKEAGGPVHQHIVEGAGHTDLIRYPAYLQAIDGFIADVTGGS